MKSKLHSKQQISTLDEILGKIKAIKTPPNGWVKEIRSALGMPERILGLRLGIKQSSLAKLEKSEINRSISLKNLDRLAEALDCEVQYALVPKKPLNQILTEQALKAAKKTLTMVDHTMTLEKQKVSRSQLQKQIEDLANHLLAIGDRSIWEEDE